MSTRSQRISNVSSASKSESQIMVVAQTDSSTVTKSRGRSRSSSRSRAAPADTTDKKSSKAAPRKRSASRSRSKSPARTAQQPRKSRTKSETTALALDEKRAGANVRGRPRSRSASRSRASPKKAEPSQEAPKTSEPLPRRRSQAAAAAAAVVVSKIDRPPTPVRHSSRIQEMVEHTTCSVSSEIKAEDTSKIVDKPSTSACAARSIFGGPLFVSLLLLVLPLGMLYLNKLCTRTNSQLRWVKLSRDWTQYFNGHSMAIAVGWFLFQALLFVLPIGTQVQGLPLRSGKRLTYRCNGFFALIVSVAALLVAKYRFHVNLGFVLSHWTSLMVSATLLSVVLSLALCLKSYCCAAPADSLTTDGGASPCWLYAWSMGRELNPRLGASFDFKFFCGLRYGAIGWVMLNLIFCLESLGKSGGGRADHALWLVSLMQLMYVADALWYERYTLSSIDIVQEGFGALLAFGYMAFMPFTYSLTTRYLVLNPTSVPSYVLLLSFFLHGIGYFIYRGANSQKHEFRCNPAAPALAHLDTIPTTLGRKLICGGWWGLVRHPNYLGDLLMSVAWSVPCGVKLALPWFYPVFLLCCLVHRALRDEAANKDKYGVAWSKYCKRVAYRILPRIF